MSQIRTIVLASASPRRKKLFELMNIPVQVSPSSIEETVNDQLSPSEVVVSLAEQKGSDVATGLSEAIVISADTIVVHKNKILGKPRNRDDAAAMLKALSGDDHFVYSGVHVIDQRAKDKINRTVSLFERTKVSFSTLDDLEIERYIDTGSPMDKAGGYGIQDDLGSLFVNKIDGDYYNVVGFPINAFYQTLKHAHRDLHKQIFSL